MLDDYCSSLSEEAQLKIAIRLCRLILPVWHKYFTEHPEMLNELNALIAAESRVKGGVKQINLQFAADAVDAIWKSYSLAAACAGDPLASMKKDPLLGSLMSVFMQPLTSSKWDDLLPYSVRLVFTSVWNILTWLILRRRNSANETHIYIAINQAADALMTEKIIGIDEIDSILLEYNEETRNLDEQESDLPVPEDVVTKGEKERQEEILQAAYKKLIPGGESIINDAPSLDQRIEILRQMREEGKTFWDQWYEYYHGTCRTYSYNMEKNCYWLSEADVIVGSFFNEYEMSEDSMLEMLSGISSYDLREDGFVF